MKIRARAERAQRGTALIVLAAILAVATTWFAANRLEHREASEAAREARSGLALAKAKRALLAYVAHYAARADHQVPGRMPCPEPLAPPAGQEGVAASLSCNGNTQTYVGRLPWRTLGIEQLRDGHGEPLWYVLGPGFRAAPINFDSSGRLSLDSVANAAVALVIAPGVPLDTLAVPESPPGGCARTGQSANRYPRPFTAFDPAQFLECGNATGSYQSVGDQRWFNDRVVAVTVAELMEAISGPLSDRLQRVAAPAIAGWDQSEFAATGKSWGATHAAPYLPYAAAFANPAANDHCGAAGVYEGLAPVAQRSSPACATAWTGTASQLSGLVDLGCISLVSELRCSFRAAGSPSAPSARINAVAPRVAASFRGTVTRSDLVVSHGGGAQLALTLSAATTNASAVIDLAWPSPIEAGVTVSVALPQLPDARLLSDPRLAWFFNNQWQRHVYYAVAPGAALAPADVCEGAGDAGCLEVRGLAALTGSHRDKRLVLALMGRPLAGQSRSCTLDTDANGVADCDDPAQYLEAENALPGDRTFRADLRIPTPSPAPQPWPAFNDRLAVCPFHYTRQNGATVQICG